MMLAPARRLHRRQASPLDTSDYAWMTRQHLRNLLLLLACVAFHTVRSETLVVPDGSTASGGCSGDPSQPLPLELDDVREGSLRPGCLQYYELPHEALQGTICDPESSNSNSSFLYFELWEMTPNSDSTAPGASFALRVDPLLIVSARTPAAAAYLEADETWQYVDAQPTSEGGGGVIADTQAVAADWAAYKLLRPYHAVTMLAASGAGGGGAWFVTVQNSDVGLANELSYVVRATCVGAPQCPSGEEAPTASGGGSSTCSGRGACNFVDEACQGGASGGECARCACEEGWGDVGCNVALERLSLGQAVQSPGTNTGNWMYYELRVPEGTRELLVELQRRSGDPVLFVKPVGGGFQAGALPGAVDYDAWGDGLRYAERVNDQWMHFSNLTDERYYVGVYSYDLFMEFHDKYNIGVYDYDLVAKYYSFSDTHVRFLASMEPSSVVLTARSTDDPIKRLCPRDCSDRGSCSRGGECTCDVGWTGAGCEFEVQRLRYGQVAQGTLAAGQWVFFELFLGGSPAERQLWSKGLMLTFRATGGHPVVLEASGRVPSLAANDVLFFWREGLSGDECLEGASSAVEACNEEGRYVLQGSELQAGRWIVGVVHGLDLFEEDFDYYLSVDSSALSSSSLRESILFILFASVFPAIAAVIGLFSIAFAAFTWQRRGRTAGGGDARAGGADVDATARQQPRCVILTESFPSRPYERPTPHANCSGECSDGDGDGESEGAPSCAVCLGAYEEGEMVCTLPCGHEFHLKCIELWLSAHDSCPICRAHAAPDVAPGVGGGAGPGTIDIPRIIARAEILDRHFYDSGPRPPARAPAAPAPPPRPMRSRVLRLLRSPFARRRTAEEARARDVERGQGGAVELRSVTRAPSTGGPAWIGPRGSYGAAGSYGVTVERALPVDPPQAGSGGTAGTTWIGPGGGPAAR